MPPSLHNIRPVVEDELPDVMPALIDKSVTFRTVGGLKSQIKLLRELIIWPLLFPKVYEEMGAAISRGVIFYGPPGTGKTMMAHAICNEVTAQCGKVVNVFVRNGADCLSKYVGESEQMLTKLFTKAKQMQPSIIVFDELDGLAPERSSSATGTDGVYSSVVTTLLGLMDGMNKLGDVFVIGITNRLDRIDSALLRPGRFDHNILFNIPNSAARESILRIKTELWNMDVEKAELKFVANRLAGWTGADIMSLCTATFCTAMRRQFPPKSLKGFSIEFDDLLASIRTITPTKMRRVPGTSCEVLPEEQRLLAGARRLAVNILKKEFSPLSFDDEESDTDEELDSDFPPPAELAKYMCQPRIMLAGDKDQGQWILANLILREIGDYQTYNLTVGVVQEGGVSGIERIFNNAASTKPSVITIFDINTLWTSVDESVQKVLENKLEQTTGDILVFTTSNVPLDDLPHELRTMFASRCVSMTNPSDEDRRIYFQSFILDSILQCAEYEQIIRKKGRLSPRDLDLKTDEATKLKSLLEQLAKCCVDWTIKQLSDLRSFMAGDIMVFLNEHKQNNTKPKRLDLIEILIAARLSYLRLHNLPLR